MKIKEIKIEVKHEGWYHSNDLEKMVKELGLKLNYWYSKDEYTLVLVCTNL